MRLKAATAGTLFPLYFRAVPLTFPLVHGGDQALGGQSRNVYTSMSDERRKLVWIGRSEKDFKRFPVEVQVALSHALGLAAIGEPVIPNAKPLSKGILKGLGVVEMIQDFDGDTYRAVYTARIGAVLAVLHAFKKKSKSGIATPRHEIRLIRDRYRVALRQHSNNAHRHGR